MCGISGFIAMKGDFDKNVNKTLRLMSPRGPDYQNYVKFNDKKREIYLLHSRLNIIDLQDRSNQPFKIGDFTIIFNGEIYNYLEIRKNLEKKYFFKTNSDTEVLLYSFIEYGASCQDILNGMWSFVIWDDKNKSLFLSRDPFGEKPVYYTFVDNNFFFGSEIKYLFSLSNKKKKINKNKINSFLFNGYKSIHNDRNTFFEEVVELPSGTSLKIDQNNNYKINTYFTKKKNNEILDFNLNEIIKKNKECLIQSVDIRMRSDVPIAFCLSGGIDSGSLVSIASKILNKKVSCFSIIDSDDRYNEHRNIKKIVDNYSIDHHPIFLKNIKHSFFERLSKLVDYHDSPIATISYYIHSYLLEAISKNNFRVSISGTGADELYTGYYDHYNQYFASNPKNSKNFKQNLKYWKKFIMPNLRNPGLKNLRFYIENPFSMSNVLEKNFKLDQFSRNKFKIENLTQKNFSRNILRNRMLNEMFHEVVPVILKHDDHNSMMHSVENRSPFLDKNLLSLANSIPTQHLINDGYQKFILRESMKDILIDDIRLDRVKKGFNASINSVLDLKNQTVIERIFNKDNLINDYINLKKLLDSINLNKIPNHISKLIFSIISTELFLTKNL